MSAPPGDDEPLRLAEACRVLFGGRLTPSALRAEARRGTLVIERIAGKDFVTPAAIRAMREKCRVPPSRPDSISDATPTASGDGSSSIEAGRRAQEHVREMLRQRSAPSSATLPPATRRRPARLIPIR